MIKKYTYDNVMIAISSNTKATLKRIKALKHFKNMEETIKFLLTEAKVI